jgi:hypothetical protein
MCPHQQCEENCNPVHWLQFWSDAQSDQVTAFPRGKVKPHGDIVDTSKLEQWNDVPAAGVDYARARDSIKAHVADLIRRLSKRQAIYAD